MKKKLIIALILAVSVFSFAGISNSVLASGGNPAGTIKGAVDDIIPGGGGSTPDAGGIAKMVIDVLLFLIGVSSVIVIVFSGLTMVLSNGDPAKVAKARGAILNAVIGVIVSLLAYGIITFVVNSFSGRSSS